MKLGAVNNFQTTFYGVKVNNLKKINRNIVKVSCDNHQKPKGLTTSPIRRDLDDLGDEPFMQGVSRVSGAAWYSFLATLTCGCLTGIFESS